MSGPGTSGRLLTFRACLIDKKSQRPIFCRQFCDNTGLLMLLNADKHPNVDK